MRLGQQARAELLRLWTALLCRAVKYLECFYSVGDAVRDLL